MLGRRGAAQLRRQELEHSRGGNLTCLRRRREQQGSKVKKNKVQPTRVQHSPEKGIGTAQGDWKRSCWEGENGEEEVEEKNDV